MDLAHTQDSSRSFCSVIKDITDQDSSEGLINQTPPGVTGPYSLVLIGNTASLICIWPQLMFQIFILGDKELSEYLTRFGLKVQFHITAFANLTSTHSQVFFLDTNLIISTSCLMRVLNSRESRTLRVVLKAPCDAWPLLQFSLVLCPPPASYAPAVLWELKTTRPLISLALCPG